MKIPRDIGGQELARLLSKYDYQITRQKGSHIRLLNFNKRWIQPSGTLSAVSIESERSITTRINGEHHITIPNHMPLKIGTVSSILTDISEHLKMDKRALIIELFR